MREFLNSNQSYSTKWWLEGSITPTKVKMAKGRVVIVPGNGGGDVEHANWYGWLKNKLIEVSLDRSIIEK